MIKDKHVLFLQQSWFSAGYPVFHKKNMIMGGRGNFLETHGMSGPGKLENPPKNPKTDLTFLS